MTCAFFGGSACGAEAATRYFVFLAKPPIPPPNRTHHSRPSGRPACALPKTKEERRIKGSHTFDRERSRVGGGCVFRDRCVLRAHGSSLVTIFSSVDRVGRERLVYTSRMPIQHSSVATSCEESGVGKIQCVTWTRHRGRAIALVV